MSEMFPESKKFPQRAFGQALGIIVWRTWYPALIHGHHNVVTTYDFPVRIKFIDNYRAPEDKKEEWLNWNIPKYIEVAKELESEGVAAICTNCGLTGTMQEEISNAVDIPVFTSSLMQVPFVSCSIGKKKKVGILIASARMARAQNFKMLRSCGIDESIPIVLIGMDESEDVDIWRTQFNPDSDYDPKKVEKVMVAVANKMIADNPDIGAIVLECTEMPLYAAAVRDATDLLVFDSSTMIKYVYNAIVKKHYF